MKNSSNIISVFIVANIQLQSIFLANVTRKIGNVEPEPKPQSPYGPDMFVHGFVVLF